MQGNMDRHNFHTDIQHHHLLLNGNLFIDISIRGPLTSIK